MCSVKFELSSTEIQIILRLFLVHHILLQIKSVSSQPASNALQCGRLSDWVNWLELAWQYIAKTRNNLSIIWISLDQGTSVGCLRSQHWKLQMLLSLFGLAVIILTIGLAIIGSRNLYSWYEKQLRIHNQLTEKILNGL